MGKVWEASYGSGVRSVWLSYRGLEEEVKAISPLDNVGAVDVCVVTKDQLLEVEESSLVDNLERER